MKTVKSLSLAWIFIALLSSAEASYNVQQYWITPNNTEIYFTHVINGVPDSQVGHYGCWTGTMWGIPVVMVGGDEQFQAYSIMTPVGTNLQYIGEFGGNANSWGTSGYFQQALLFLPQTMNIGDQVQTTNNRYGLDPSIRAQVTSVLNRTATITLSAHYDQYQIPELAYLGSNDPVYNDVIYLKFVPSTNDNRVEEYWLQKNVGKIRCVISSIGLLDYATPAPFGYGSNGVQTSGVTQQTPENPWYSPVPNTINSGAAYVWNGSFEDGLVGWTIGGEIYEGYPVSTPAQRTTVVTFTPVPYQNGQDEAGTHQVCMQGSTSDNHLYTYVQSVQLVPVIPGATYQLSGWIYRPTVTGGTKADTATIAFVGGWNSGGSPVSDGPTQVATYSGGTQPQDTWYQVSVQVTMPADVYNTEVICSRNGPVITPPTVTESFFDDIRLQLIALPAGYHLPGT